MPSRPTAVLLVLQAGVVHLPFLQAVFGNTRRIAEAVARGIAGGLGEAAQVRHVDVGDAPRSVDDADLLVVGGPTHAFAMTDAPRDARAAAFDTRAAVMIDGDAGQRVVLFLDCAEHSLICGFSIARDPD